MTQFDLKPFSLPALSSDKSSLSLFVNSLSPIYYCDEVFIDVSSLFLFDPSLCFRLVMNSSLYLSVLYDIFDDIFYNQREIYYKPPTGRDEIENSGNGRCEIENSGNGRCEIENSGNGRCEIENSGNGRCEIENSGNPINYTSYGNQNSVHPEHIPLSRVSSEHIPLSRVSSEHTPLSRVSSEHIPFQRDLSMSTPISSLFMFHRIVRSKEKFPDSSLTDLFPGDLLREYSIIFVFNKLSVDSLIAYLNSESNSQMMNTTHPFNHSMNNQMICDRNNLITNESPNYTQQTDNRTFLGGDPSSNESPNYTQQTNPALFLGGDPSSNESPNYTQQTNPNSFLGGDPSSKSPTTICPGLCFIPVRALTSPFLGSLVFTRGIITKCSMFSPFLSTAAYFCDMCGSETFQTKQRDLRSEGGSKFGLLRHCSSSVCLNKKSPLLLIPRASKFLSVGEFHLSELLVDVPSSFSPKFVRLICKKDFKISPGAVCYVSGVLNFDYSFYIDVHTIYNQKRQEGGETEKQLSGNPSTTNITLNQDITNTPHHSISICTTNLSSDLTSRVSNENHNGVSCNENQHGVSCNENQNNVSCNGNHTPCNDNQNNFSCNDNQNNFSCNGNHTPCNENQNNVSCNGNYTPCNDNQNNVSCNGNYTPCNDNQNNFSCNENQNNVSCNGNYTPCNDNQNNVSCNGNHTPCNDNQHGVSCNGNYTPCNDNQNNVSCNINGLNKFNHCINMNRFSYESSHFNHTTDDICSNLLFSGSLMGWLDIMCLLFARNVYGLKDVKKVLLLTIVGSKKLSFDGLSIRGSINTLLVGDPGTCKSELLRCVQKVTDCVYVTGCGSSSAGLTATLLKDKREFTGLNHITNRNRSGYIENSGHGTSSFKKDGLNRPDSNMTNSYIINNHLKSDTLNGNFYLEAGALVLGDNGICCIDELDKLSKTDRAALHEAMEQQKVSINKANIQATLNARTTLIAAANPIKGFYDKKRSVEWNVGFERSLISRFDNLIIVNSDINDEKLAKHILNPKTLNIENNKKQINLKNSTISNSRINKLNTLSNNSTKKIYTFNNKSTLVSQPNDGNYGHGNGHKGNVHSNYAHEGNDGNGHGNYALKGNDGNGHGNCAHKGNDAYEANDDNTHKGNDGNGHSNCALKGNDAYEANDDNTHKGNDGNGHKGNGHGNYGHGNGHKGNGHGNCAHKGNDAHEGNDGNTHKGNGHGNYAYEGNDGNYSYEVNGHGVSNASQPYESNNASPLYDPVSNGPTRDDLLFAESLCSDPLSDDKASLSLLREHLQRAKNVDCCLSEDAAERLINAYNERRQTHKETTPRNLLALIRMTIALAKMELKEIATEKEANQIITLTEQQELQTNEKKKTTTTTTNNNNNLYAWICEKAINGKIKTEKIINESKYSKKEIEETIEKYTDIGAIIQENNELYLR